MNTAHQTCARRTLIPVAQVADKRGVSETSPYLQRNKFCERPRVFGEPDLQIAFMTAVN
jgi:hypothetical protein